MSTRALHHGLAWTRPNELHLSQERFGIRSSVEFQVDEYIVRLVDLAKDLIASDTGPFPVRGIVVKDLLPPGEIWNCVLDSHDRHIVLPSHIRRLWLAR